MSAAPDFFGSLILEKWTFEQSEQSATLLRAGDIRSPCR
jgi:hypothetical protein